MEHRDPTTLRPHPAIKAWPRWAKDSDGWRAFVEDIRAHGITHPIQVTHGNLVVDGETRRQAALALQIAPVPVQIVPETEVYAVILRELCLHRAPTKSQKAYLAYPNLRAAHQEAIARQTENLRKGQCSPVADGIGNGGKKGVDFIASGLGISRDLIEYAATLHAVFDGSRREVRSQKLTTTAEELKAVWEPRILDLDKPICLGNALAGIAGGEATAGKEKGVSAATQMDFFKDGLLALTSAFAPDRWSKTPDRLRSNLITDFRLAAAAWPLELRRELAKALVEEGWEG